MWEIRYVDHNKDGEVKTEEICEVRLPEYFGRDDITILHYFRLDK